MWKRSFAFLGVTAGAALLGARMHDAPNLLTQFNANGLQGLWAAMFAVDFSMGVSWLGMMVHSLFLLWTFPFAILFLILLVQLWRDSDLFSVLFVLALTHSLHVFIYSQRVQPLAGTALAGAIAMLVTVELGGAALALWWRRVSEDAPEPEPPAETEPEL